jgi:hypothetical protein
VTDRRHPESRHELPPAGLDRALAALAVAAAREVQAAHRELPGLDRERLDACRRHVLALAASVSTLDRVTRGAIAAAEPGRAWDAEARVVAETDRIIEEAHGREQGEEP